MKLSTIGTTSAWSLAAALWLIGTGCDLKSATESSAEATAVIEQPATKGGDKDAAWKPSQSEIAIVRVGEGKQGGNLSNFCVAKDGNLLACWSVDAPAKRAGKNPAAPANEIRVFAPDGKFLKAIPLSLDPGAICVDPDGNIFVGGGGRLVKLDPQGKELLTVNSPATKLSDAQRKQAAAMFKQASKEQQEAYLQQLEARRGEITGIAVTQQDLFIACPSPNDFGFCVYRLDHQLANPKLVVDKLRGCCGQMDIQAHGDNLWIAHNARHRVQCLDRDGKQISQFGKEGRTKPEQFGGCCEPKNLRFTANNEILAAESGPPTCIKRFSPDGKFLGVLAMLKGDGNCVRVSIDVSPDGKQFYMLDTGKNAIRVFGNKGA